MLEAIRDWILKRLGGVRREKYLEALNSFHSFEYKFKGMEIAHHASNLEWADDVTKLKLKLKKCRKELREYKG